VIELHFTQITPPGVSLIPLRGKALVVEPTGRVIRTELTAGSRSNVSVTTTEFEFNAALRIDVPVRLRDVMPASDTDEFIGRAEYSNFRRFQVRAEQESTSRRNRNNESFAMAGAVGFFSDRKRRSWSVLSRPLDVIDYHSW
jgi:hypothetical protein